MTDYKILTDEERDKALARFPKIRADRLTRKVNELFRAYLFVRRSYAEVEVWTSCCGKHETMARIPRTITPEMRPMLEGKHNEKAACPYCGRAVTVKEAGRLGKRKNLLEYHPVVFLNAKGGDLYARCYWARKDYKGDLAEAPKFMGTYFFRFSIGKTEAWRENYWSRGMSYKCVEGNYDPNHRPLSEPFYDGGGMGIRYLPYTVYGIEAIQKSGFRYCQYESFRGAEGPENVHADLIKYLTAASIYPRQIEMLMKGGGRPLVHDLVVGRRKNSGIFNWKETDPKKALGLNGAELRAWRESGGSIWLIEWYKYLRRKKMPTGFPALARIEKKMDVRLGEFCKWAYLHDMTPERLERYLERFTTGHSFFAVWRELIDYRACMETLGRDLDVETVAWPRDLHRAHDEAARELTLMRQREQSKRDAKLRAAAEESLRKRREKYNVTLDGYLIRIAETPAEIREEGRVLEHCVGGYAERHMDGAVTILFLRSQETPDVPLYTIEMHGDQLIQIHGYRNEGVYNGGRFAPDPRKTMRGVLDPWLEWLKKGSRRNEKGQPVGLKPKKARGAA